MQVVAARSGMRSRRRNADRDPADAGDRPHEAALVDLEGPEGHVLKAVPGRGLLPEHSERGGPQLQGIEILARREGPDGLLKFRRRRQELPAGALLGLVADLGIEGVELLGLCDEFRRPLGESGATADSAAAPAVPRLGPATEAPLGSAPAVKLD